jgi:hypothetical protein
VRPGVRSGAPQPGRQSGTHPSKGRCRARTSRSLGRARDFTCPITPALRYLAQMARSAHELPEGVNTALRSTHPVWNPRLRGNDVIRDKRASAAHIGPYVCGVRPGPRRRRSRRPSMRQRAVPTRRPTRSGTGPQRTTPARLGPLLRGGAPTVHLRATLLLPPPGIHRFRQLGRWNHRGCLGASDW